jgi:hypothetical protein
MVYMGSSSVDFLLAGVYLAFGHLCLGVPAPEITPSSANHLHSFSWGGFEGLKRERPDLLLRLVDGVGLSHTQTMVCW